jgi:potassium-transporting ATPase KdpC subunit
VWFQADKFGGKPGIVGQWADAHNSLAQGWVTGNATHGAYVRAWSKAHPDIVAQFVKDNPLTPKTAAADLAVVFFERYSKDHRGTFPGPATRNGQSGQGRDGNRASENRLRYPDAFQYSRNRRVG